ncbi:MAG TPA: zf-HC2 domain-containing protein [Pyrinomonadaceae bacterium]
MKLTTPHIAFARLADLAEGRLTPEERARDEEHLAACARCSRQLAELRHVTTLMRTDDSMDVPHGLVSDAIRMFRSHPSVERAPGLLRRVLATLSFDSSALTPAFGVRSGQAAPARQMLFSAGGFDIDLRLAEGGAGWTISGQVLGPCDGGGRVEVLSADDQERVAAADLNDLCEFTLPPVAAGAYVLRLRLGETEVEVPGLDLGA